MANKDQHDNELAVARGMGILYMVQKEMRLREALAPIRQQLRDYPPEQSMEGVTRYLISVELPLDAAKLLRDFFEGGTW